MHRPKETDGGLVTLDSLRFLCLRPNLAQCLKFREGSFQLYSVCSVSICIVLLFPGDTTCNHHHQLLPTAPLSTVTQQTHAVTHLEAVSGFVLQKSFYPACLAFFYVISTLYFICFTSKRKRFCFHLWEFSPESTWSENMYLDVSHI